MAVDCAKSLKVEDAGALGVFTSSDWGERCFCSKCGSTLFWRMRDGSSAHVCAQAFDDPSVFTFAEEIFIDDKPDNYAFANDTRKLTGAEVMALFAQQDGTTDG